LVSENIEEEAPEDSGYVNLGFGHIYSVIYKSLPNKLPLNLSFYMCWMVIAIKEISEMLGTSMGLQKSNSCRQELIFKRKNLKQIRQGIINGKGKLSLFVISVKQLKKHEWK